MPGGDRTGPMGQGAMSGGRRGFCKSSNKAGFKNSFFGKGLRGFFGFQKSSPFQNLTPENEIKYLRREAEGLEAHLSEIKSRLAELEKSNPTKVTNKREG